MRKGTMDSAIIMNGIQAIGINLGWDYCAEHEWGIKGIRNALGISGVSQKAKHLIGADARTVTKVSDGLKFFEDLNGYAYLVFSESFKYSNSESLDAEQLDRMLEARSDENLSTAWSEEAFGIRIKNCENVEKNGNILLGQIHEAFIKKDIIIFFGGTDNPFANSGLIIAIRSRLPQEIIDKMKEIDEDHLRLTEAANKTGIHERLKSAGRSYYALSPRWTSSIQSASNKIETKYPVVFWLNPQNQGRNNFGWFTVEQLLDWINDKGPIPKH